MGKVECIIGFIAEMMDMYMCPKYMIEEVSKDKNIRSAEVVEINAEADDGVLYFGDLHRSILKNDLVIANVFIEDIKEVFVEERSFEILLNNDYIIKVRLIK